MKTRHILSSLAVMTALSGCGVLEQWSKNWPPGSSAQDNYQYPAEADNIPAGSWVQPAIAKPVQQQPVQGLAPAHGLKPMSVAENMNEPLGTEEIRTRFMTLEQQVQSIHQDMQQISPLLERLALMEQSMRELSDALKTAHGSQEMAQHSAPMHNKSMPAAGQSIASTMASDKPMTLQPAMAKPNTGAIPKNVAMPKTTMAPKPAKVQPASYGPSVTGIRFGKYKGQDRVVLDLTAPAQFRYDLDNTEKLLIIELPGAAWGAQMAKQIKKSGAIKAYNAQPGPNGGTQLIFSLKKNARITQARALPPNSTYGHRIFMDIQ